jgi:starch synthase
MRYSKPLRVLFIASEADPFMKVGGLGDVAGSLPRAIHKLNRPEHPEADDQVGAAQKMIDIRLVLPYHGAIAAASRNLRPVVSFNVARQDGPVPALAFDQEMEGVPVYLVSGEPIPPDQPIYTGDPEIDGNKYTFFSLAALELVRALGWQPDVLHANEWHTAPAIYALSIRKDDSFFSKTSTLLGIHNLPYMGNGAGPALSAYGLPPASASNLPTWAQHLPFPLGLLAADHLVAVSPAYAQEILTPEFGSGLSDFLQERAASISGILNGLDIDQWNPQTDPHLIANYSLDNLQPRTLVKRALQEELGLQVDPEIPLLGMITRMDYQKGVDLALDALRQIDLPEASHHHRWQTVILGMGMPELEEAARRMQTDFPEQIRALITFDSALSRRIYGGADALLIPSRYEPCGLTQMMAMRYGCVPIARATGGIKCTIRHYTDKKGSGFLFSEPTPEALSGTIRDALRLYQDQQAWQKLQREGMRHDFSWERSARAYLSLYRSLVSLRRKS